MIKQFWCTAVASGCHSSATAGTANASANRFPIRTTFWRFHRKFLFQPVLVTWTCLACAAHFGPRRQFNSIWNWTTCGHQPTWSNANSKWIAASSVYDDRHRHPTRPFWPWRNLLSDRRKSNFSSTWTCTRMASSVASPSSKFSSTSRNTNSRI